ncbi:MAG TPA: hypothetical protein VKU41_27890 [Polyangiaceae bacterium]|nr:hypothetical protein [Polyangiaceae bacterium]
MADPDRSSLDNVEEAIRRSTRYMPASAAAQLQAFLTKENLEILGGTTVVWAGAHLFGVGEVVDVALLLVGAATVGANIGQVVEDLYTFATVAIGATSDADIDRAAHAFADAVILGGVTTVMVILLHKSASDIQAARGATFAEAARPKDPGLVPVGPDPKPPNPILPDPSLPAGEGVTDWWGNVRFSTQGSATEQQLVRIHELVHRFLTPKMGPLRGFRVRLRASRYYRSALFKYLEEALAETIAQLRVNGLSGLIEGLRYPVKNGTIYMKFGTVPMGRALMIEGAHLTTIIVGTQQIVIFFQPGPPEPSKGAHRKR